MLQNLEQTFNQNGEVVFKTPQPTYNPEDSETINAVIQDLESNSPSLLLINFYTPAAKFYMSDTELEEPIKLVVNNGENFTRVLKALKTNTHLIELCLCGYTITDEQAKELGEVLATHPSLQTLRIYHTKLNENGCDFLAQGIIRNKQIHSLYFCEGKIAYEGIKKIDDALKNNHFITKTEITNIITFPLLMQNQDRYSIHLSMTQNQAFWKQRRALEERFILLEELNIIPKDPQRKEYDLVLKRNKTGQSKNFSKEEIVSELAKELLPDIILNAPHSSASSSEDIYQNLSEENILSFISLFEKMTAITKNLEREGFEAWRNLLERVKQAEAYFYLMSDQIILFFELYRDYFRIPGNAEIDFQFAERIFNYRNTGEDRHTLALLGLHDDRLRCQYVIKLLEGNLTPGAARLRKSAYCKLHNLHNDPNVSSLEEAIGVDRILTNYQLLLLSSDVNSITNQSFGSCGYKCSTEFETFYRSIQEYCKLSEPDKKRCVEELKQRLDALPGSQEKQGARILLDISEGKKIALYSQLRQKKPNEPVKLLTFTWLDAEKRPALNLQEFSQSYPSLDKQQMDSVEQQVHLKHTLAQNLGYGAYETVFDLPSTQTITWEHSRILSATRLATLSSDFTHDQMIKILQIEYAALPDSDKENTTSLFSFFTSYRNRTLEKALEAVFEKEKILPMDIDTIKNNENKSLAFAILQWIGDQERSFYYKTSKNPDLFRAMQNLGILAHKMVVCDKPKTLEEILSNSPLAKLKKETKEELDKISKISSFVDVTFLTEKLQLDASSSQQKPQTR